MEILVALLSDEECSVIVGGAAGTRPEAGTRYDMAAGTTLAAAPFPRPEVEEEPIRNLISPNTAWPMPFYDGARMALDPANSYDLLEPFIMDEIFNSLITV
jgi:hypothetical protein